MSGLPVAFSKEEKSQLWDPLRAEQLQNEPKKIVELIKSNLHNIAMQHPTGSFMPGILDSEKKGQKKFAAIKQEVSNVLL